MNSPRHFFALLFFLPAAAIADIPGDRVIPPATLFAEVYDRTDNEPEWDEYLDGKPLDLSKTHVALELAFSKAPLATLLIIAYPSEDGAMKNFMGGREQMEKQPLVALSPLTDVKDGRYFTTQVMGRSSCSMVISNVHFVINDPGGDLSTKTVLDWSNRYADFLRKSISKPGALAVQQPKPGHEKWTGSNGKIVIGTVKGIDARRQSVEFITEAGSLVPSLPLTKFSEADRKRILERFPE
ncbi:MAG TPA: hypothetical protein PLB55_16150 [Prosthecobacter sp.]|nr:hypothetical protein [Prosthecobacter sp.]